SGATTLTATSNGTANATARGAGGGVADVNVITPSAEVNGRTRVYVGPDTTLGATSVTGTADATTHANAYATLLSISAVDVTLVHLSTDIHQDTSGFIGTNADVTATGAVSLTATSHHTATSTTSSLAGSLVADGRYDLKAHTTSHTAAFVGDKTHVTVRTPTLSAEATGSPIVRLRP